MISKRVHPDFKIPSEGVPVFGSSQRRHGISNCNPEDSSCGVNLLPVAVSAAGSKSKQRSAVTLLKVLHPAGDTLYATREGAESQGEVAIETW
jgi:hypothetical protein